MRAFLFLGVACLIVASMPRQMHHQKHPVLAMLNHPQMHRQKHPVLAMLNQSQVDRKVKKLTNIAATTTKKIVQQHI
uniref:Uncharacterized protein n=1 Tax=Globodera rostochiensis TaxID=31243 RepID=A0A914IFH4_GLORO